HITTERGWRIAREMGEYRAHSLKNEGFIHCSTLEQIPKVVAAFYQNQPDLLVLAISPEQLQAPVKWEQPQHPNPENATLELLSRPQWDRLVIRRGLSIDTTLPDY
ncbi:MAG: DUF952 domain-containing protein, partial [Microcystis panniformis]